VIKLSQQLALDLPAEPRFGREDFLVSPSNAAGWEMFERWPEWPSRTLLLCGPPGAGKSHLAAIWAERAGARILAGRSLALADLPALANAGATLVEDADEAPISERELFHLINLARDENCWLVMTARARPDAWAVATADLLSRLRAAPVVEIGQPDDALVRAVLVKLFVDRQLVVDATVVEYLALRIERSLDAARSVVAALDREALARGRAVTRPMAGEILRRLSERPSS
jgi:chromosomal replication initiation ATPase DnaA